jgi:MFS family permease
MATDIAEGTTDTTVVIGYAVTFGGLLLGGRAGDILGRRRMFVAGIGLFTFASLAAGLATQPWLLIAARMLQGTGAAATLLALAVTLITIRVRREDLPASPLPV